MKIVGLTGGIGSGKTTVAKMFMSLGIPVYNADAEAKKLMNNHTGIKDQLRNHFGDEVYKDSRLNREYLSSIVFNNKSELEILNSIVHPVVADHFKEWVSEQNSFYVIKEAAIIFEHAKENEYDFIITVIANMESRIDRIIKRDNTTRSKILKIISNQLSDEEKVKKSDFVVRNNSLENTQMEVLKIHKKLMELCVK